MDPDPDVPPCPLGGRIHDVRSPLDSLHLNLALLEDLVRQEPMGAETRRRLRARLAALARAVASASGQVSELDALVRPTRPEDCPGRVQGRATRARSRPDRP